jgi:replicative DNA helicase
VSIERKLISKMTSAVEISKIWDSGLRAPVFDDPINRRVFEWMVDYWQGNDQAMAPTWVVMELEFPSIKLDTEVTESTEWMIGHLQQRHTTKQMQRLILEASETLDEDPIASASRLWREAYDLAEIHAPRTTRANMADLSDIEDRRRRLASRGADTGTGVPFGLAELDAHTRGQLPGELAIVAARTKVGKSFLLCLCAIQAHLAGLKPVLFTLEMSIPEMRDRIDAFASGVSYTQIQQGTLLPAGTERLHAAQDALRERGDLHVERPVRGERTVKNMVSRTRQLGGDIILIDQLSFMDADRDYTGDRATTMKHGDIIYELKDEIARESAGALPCLLAVQHNREAVRDRGSGGRGGLANLANSDMIGQTVDIGLGLWRNDDMRANNVMGMDIMGSRRCDNESWLLNWRLNDRTQVEIREVFVE